MAKDGDGDNLHLVGLRGLNRGNDRIIICGRCAFAEEMDDGDALGGNDGIGHRRSLETSAQSTSVGGYEQKHPPSVG